MSSSSAIRVVSERFAELYAQPRSDAALKLEQEVFGTSIGATGYTTKSQANRLILALGLRPSDLLLEIGSGRGWPGLWLARETGCRLVQTDPQASALAAARLSARRMGVEQRSSATVAGGRHLPFATRTFDAVSHADVLC